MEQSKFATLSSLFAFLMVITSRIFIPVNESTFTIQIFIVVLSAILGGSMVGLTAQLIYLLFGLFVPVFNSGALAVEYFSNPANFFILIFPFVALAIGTYVYTWKPLYDMLLRATVIIIFASIVFLFANYLFTENFHLEIFIKKNTAMLISNLIETYIAVILCFYWIKYNKLAK
jgi:biotin transporter BioY